MSIGFAFSNVGRKESSAAVVRRGTEVRPSVGTALTSGFSAGYGGEGSFVEDLQAYQVNTQLGRETTFFQEAANFVASPFTDDPIESPKISQDEYEQSMYFRDDLEYKDGMTEEAARIRAENFDARRQRQQIFDQSGRVGKTLYFTSALAGGMADVKGVVAGIAAGAAVGSVVPGAGTGAGAVTGGGLKVTRGAMTAVRASRAARVAGVVAGESALATIPSVVSGVQNEAALDTEYDISNAFLDLGASALFSVGFHAGTRGLSKAYDRFTGLSDKEAVANMMATQIMAGERMDAKAIMDMQMADRVQRFSTVDRVETAPTVKKRADGTHEAFYADDEGVMAGVRGRGKSFEEAVSDLEALFTTRLNEAAGQLELKPERLEALKQAQDDRVAADTFDADKFIEDNAENLGVPIERIRETEAKLKDAQTQLKQAQAAFDERPTSAKRKADLSNAKRKETRARQEAEQVREEATSRAKPVADQEQVKLDDQANASHGVVRQMQSDEALPAFERYIRDQMENPVLADRTTDPYLEQVSLEEITQQAALATRGPLEQDLFSDAAKARSDVETQLENGTMLPETKQVVGEALKEIDNAKVRSVELMKFLKCRGGS